MPSGKINMLKDATIVMMLGMGTVFLVLVSLLGLMTLGGRLAHRYIKPDAKPQPPAGQPAADGAASPDVAVAIAAVWERNGRQEKGTGA